MTILVVPNSQNDQHGRICYLICKMSINWELECHSASIDTCPTKHKRSMYISDYMQTTVFYFGRFLKKLADDRYSSITKGSIYHIKHMFIQPFTMDMGWPEIGCLMEVSVMLNICTYCLFTWYSRYCEKLI